jgi:hypothetical protein
MLRAYQFYSLLFDTTGARNHDLPALEAIMLTIKLPMRVCSKSKRRYNDLQNTTQETKDRETRSPLKNRDDISVIWRWTIFVQSINNLVNIAEAKTILYKHDHWLIIYMWKTIASHHHFSKMRGLGTKDRYFLLKCLYQAMKVGGHALVC